MLNLHQSYVIMLQYALNRRQGLIGREAEGGRASQRYPVKKCLIGCLLFSTPVISSLGYSNVCEMALIDFPSSLSLTITHSGFTVGYTSNK